MMWRTWRDVGAPSITVLPRGSLSVTHSIHMDHYHPMSDYYQRREANRSLHRKPSPQVQKIMRQYRVDPYDEDDDDVMTPIAPRITGATYRHHSGIGSGRYDTPIKYNTEPSELSTSVDSFLADMDLRRRMRAEPHRAIASRTSPPLSLQGHYKSHTYTSYTPPQLHPIISTPNRYYGGHNKWSREGEVFAEEVRDVLSRVRISLMTSPSTYKRNGKYGKKFRHTSEVPRKSERLSYSSWKAPLSPSMDSGRSTEEGTRISTPMLTPNISRTEDQDTETKVTDADINTEINDDLEPDDKVILDPENVSEGHDTETTKRADGLILWEDIDLDDIFEDLDDDNDEWRKDKVTCLEEPGHYVGHGFRSEPVKMSAETGAVTWAKPRGELDVIITREIPGQEFICSLQAGDEGVRVSQLMSEGEEVVVITGKNDLQLHKVTSFQGHVVLILEAVCTPFQKYVFRMTYLTEAQEQGKEDEVAL